MGARSCHPSVPASSLWRFSSSYPPSFHSCPGFTKSLCTPFHPSISSSTLPSAYQSSLAPASPAQPNASERPLPFHSDLFFLLYCPFLNVFPNVNNPYNFTTTVPPVPPSSSVQCPSPVSHSLHQQILNGKYVELALLLQPSLSSLSQPSELHWCLAFMKLSNHWGSYSEDLTPTKFDLVLSLFRNMLSVSRSQAQTR